MTTHLRWAGNVLGIVVVSKITGKFCMFQHDVLISDFTVVSLLQILYT